MNAEIKNDANNNDTVEQNQNGAGPDTAAPEPSAPATELVPGDCPASSAPESIGVAPIGEAAASEGLDIPSVLENESSTTGRPAPLTSNSPGASPDPTLMPPRHRGNPGKVAQLPPEMRLFVNQQLLLGLSYRHIASLLEEKGYPGFSSSNIYHWTQGGFKAWAHSQLDLAQQTARKEAALKAAVEKGFRLDEAAMGLLLSSAVEVIPELDSTKIKAQIEGKPGQYVALFSALSRVIAHNSALERYSGVPSRLARNRDWEPSRPESNGGLTLGARAKVCKRLGIPHAPVRNPDAIEPEPEEKPAPNPQPLPDSPRPENNPPA
jgi:hypothetical protein